MWIIWLLLVVEVVVNVEQVAVAQEAIELAQVSVLPLEVNTP